jgi:hypothetical protein
VLWLAGKSRTWAFTWTAEMPQFAGFFSGWFGHPHVDIEWKR